MIDKKRKYNSIKDSYIDHSLFLTSRQRYAELFRLSVTDYKAWCRGLKSAGYATSPTYADELIKLIEDARLYEFDASENLSSKNLELAQPENELKTSPFKNDFVKLNYFALCDLLFTDETDILIQSLKLVLLPDDNEFPLAER